MPSNPIQQAWELPPACWRLEGEEVHVWSAPLDQPAPVVAQLTASLSPEELRKAAAFRFQRDQRRFAVGRGLLRSILGAYLQAHPASIGFCYGDYGKPALSLPAAARRLKFNLSHSGEFALFAVTREREVGVDLEEISWLGEADDIVKRFFSFEEKAEFQRAPLEKRQLTFLKLWTRREARLKCTGRGLGDLDDAEAGSRPFPGAACELSPSPHHVAALAVAGESFELKAWQWPACPALPPAGFSAQ